MIQVCPYSHTSEINGIAAQIERLVWSWTLGRSVSWGYHWSEAAGATLISLSARATTMCNFTAISSASHCHFR